MSSLLRPEKSKTNDSQHPLGVVGAPIWGIGCSLLLLVALLVAHPYAEVGISDDFSYVQSAKVLAQTGHVAYNGGATAILGWQLYLAAIFIKLFGFSFTSTRASIMFLSVAMTFLCQRTFVRAGMNEWNASIGTITLMLSPLLMPLEVTFMSDIPGLFAIIVCAYACLRAIQADTEWATISWIGFASLSNVLFGSSRQIAWLGALVMVPSAIWILRDRRRVVSAGISIWVVSIGLIFAINHWFQQQPYILYEPIARGPLRAHVVKQIGVELLRACFEIVLVLLPILLMCLPALRMKKYPWVVYLAGVGIFLYGLHLWLDRSLVAWWAPYLNGGLQFVYFGGARPILSIAVPLCLLAILAAVLTRARKSTGALEQDSSWLSDRTIATLLGPFAIAYVGLLVPRAGFENIWDRYILPLLFVTIILFVRFYQQRFQACLPVTALVLAICVALFATASLHDRLAQYRARVAAVNEVLATGVPVTAVSGGWDYDGSTELQIAGHIVDPRMRLPPGVKFPLPTHYGLKNCPWFYCNMFPHVVPQYTISLVPDPVLGVRFAPVPYRTWIDPPGTVYVVRFSDSWNGHGLP